MGLYQFVLSYQITLFLELRYEFEFEINHIKVIFFKCITTCFFFYVDDCLHILKLLSIR